MASLKRLPSARILNSDLTAELGRPVVKFEVLPIEAGDRLTVTVKSQSGQWRQGIWLGVVSVDQIDHPSLIPVFIVNLRDPALAFGLCLPSVFSLGVVHDMVRRGIQIRFTDPTGWPEPHKDL